MVELETSLATGQHLLGYVRDPYVSLALTSKVRYTVTISCPFAQPNSNKW